MRVPRIKTRWWQMKPLLSSPMACNRANFLLLFYSKIRRKEGHIHPQARNVLSEQFAWTSAFGKGKKKTALGSWKQNLWQTCSGTITSCSFTFWHHFALPTVRRCQSPCFPMKSSSSCYHKCQCVLTITAGVHSGEEVNDQQATVVTKVQMDAFTPKLLI